jgi:hypothetical protein
VLQFELVSTPILDATACPKSLKLPPFFYIRPVEYLAFMLGHHPDELAGMARNGDAPGRNPHARKALPMIGMKLPQRLAKNRLYFIECCRAPDFHVSNRLTNDRAADFSFAGATIRRTGWAREETRV